MLNANNENDPCTLDPRVLWKDHEHGLNDARRKAYIFVRPVEAYRALLQVIREDPTGWYRHSLYNRHIFVSEDQLGHVESVLSSLPWRKLRPGKGHVPQQKLKKRTEIMIPDSYYYNTTVFQNASFQIRKRPHPPSSMTSRSVKSCPEAIDCSVDIKTDEDLLCGQRAVDIETGREMWCELIQNLKTDEDLIFGAGFQAMQLDSQEWQLPANQERHFPTKEELVDS
jgi:hypothetical protein